ncbi:MAG: sigma-54-dependent Fis family transcriptional regulator [Nanoarchaeota archaeon]|nr:sigma-54-dependent Fis family transcriptional regulator [Nanoarchaeota archaeon]
MDIEFKNYSEPVYRIAHDNGKIIGRNPKMINLFLNLNKVASDRNKDVLIIGPTGTGKELCAHAIHYNSTRRDNHFVRVNCGSMTEGLLESELFGHEKGAFTGATRRKPGYFERADGGTILLDEIGNMPIKLQPTLLRILEDRFSTPLGGEKGKLLDFRLIYSTNKSLEEGIKEGTFAEDLYHRINRYSLEVPTLIERGKDIMLIAKYLLEMRSRQSGKQVFHFAENAKKDILGHNWSGNVRELGNVIGRAHSSARSNTVTSDDIYFGSKMPNLLHELSPEMLKEIKKESA